jgi:hydrogenase nickel incorporation protein HypA/HybF
VHELAITQNLLTTVLDEAKAAGGYKVTIINLVVGELSGVSGDCVQFYFDILKKDTIAGSAVINFRQVPAQLKCRDCSTGFSPETELWVCPGCGSYNIEIAGGKDCFIDSIEIEP